MARPKILAFAGSTRTDSFNKKLIKVAAAGAREAGADVTVIDLRDYPMPLYDEDLEKQEGLPSNTRKLKELMLAHQGFLISCFKNKVAGIMSASPGGLGGLRGLVHVRAILENIGVMVIPNQIAISKANDVFNLDGTMKDQKQEQQVRKIGDNLAQMLMKLN